MRPRIGTEICTALQSSPENNFSNISITVRFASELSRAHHERSELSDGHDGFMNVYVLISAVAIELHGGAEVEGGDHGASATHAVGAVHQSWAVAGKEATGTSMINLNQTQYFIITQDF